MKLITKDTKTRPKVILFNLLSELGYIDIFDFQKKNNLAVDGYFGKNSYAALYELLLNVKNVDFESYYFKTVFPKNQIIWHHSAGWDNARGMFEWWKRDGRTHVATSVGITDDGTVWRGYDEDYWAASIGAKHINNRILDEQSVTVEICNWGNLTEKNGKLYSWANAEVSKDKAIELNYKGFKWFEKYTEHEIKALKYWTLLNAMRYDIPLEYKENDMWKISNNAFNRVSGIYTHNSYRNDKTDVSPQPLLIDMAKSLINYSK